MTKYAQNTSVSSDRSRAEIERTLTRFGASRFASGWDGETGQSVIGFTITGRSVRITLPLPNANDPMIRLTPAGRVRTQTQIDVEFEKEDRRRWRSLAAVIKAKLVAVSDGISTVEREFMADVVLPSGATMHEWVGPQFGLIDTMPALLPGAS